MITISCNNCKKKLAEADIQRGTVIIKCGKCGIITEYAILPQGPSSTLIRIPERQREGSPEA